MDRLIKKTLHWGFPQTRLMNSGAESDQRGWGVGVGLDIKNKEGESDGSHSHVTQDANSTRTKIQECVFDWRGWRSKRILSVCLSVCPHFCKMLLLWLLLRVLLSMTSFFFFFASMFSIRDFFFFWSRKRSYMKKINKYRRCKFGDKESTFLDVNLSNWINVKA